MDLHTKLIECDGNIYDVYTNRSQRNTIAGTVWRFILDGNRTLVVTPYQTLSSPATDIPGIPEKIESIYGGLSNFHETVYGAKFNDPDEWSEIDDEAKIQKATDKELRIWRSTHKLTVVDRWEKDRAAAHRELRAKWDSAGCGYSMKGMDMPAKREVIRKGVWAKYRLEDPKRMRAVKQGQDKVGAAGNKIEAKHQKLAESVRTQRATKWRIITLQRLRRMLNFYGVELSDAGKLDELFAFIRDGIEHHGIEDLEICDDCFQAILAKVRRLTGKDISERVFRDYASEVPAQVEALAKGMAATDGIEISEARAKILQDVNFVATFGNHGLFFIKGFSIHCHDEKDSAAYSLVASNQARLQDRRGEYATQVAMRKLSRLEFPRVQSIDNDSGDPAHRQEGWIQELSENVERWVAENGKRSLPLNSPYIRKSAGVAEVMGLGKIGRGKINRLLENRASTGHRFWSSKDPDHKGDAGYFVTPEELSAYDEHQKRATT